MSFLLFDAGGLLKNIKLTSKDIIFTHVVVSVNFQVSSSVCNGDGETILYLDKNLRVEGV